MEPDSSWWYPLTGQEGIRTNQNHEIQSEHTKTPFFRLDGLRRYLPPLTILGFVILCCSLSHSPSPVFPFLPLFPHTRGLICDLSQNFSWSWKKAKMLWWSQGWQTRLLDLRKWWEQPSQLKDLAVATIWSHDLYCLSSRSNVSVQICCELSRRMSIRNTPEEFLVGFFTNQRKRVNSWAPSLGSYHLWSSPVCVLISS